MIPVKFPQANQSFGPPPDLDASQCLRIWAHIGIVQGGSLDGSSMVITAWRPDAVELENLNRGGLVYLTCLGGLPPHFLSTLFSEARKVI